jgi:hypothetical protein
MTLVTRHKVDEIRATETGPELSRSRIEHILVREWRRAEIWVFEQLKNESAYLRFCAEVGQFMGKDMRAELDDAARVLVTGVFENQPCDARESLGLLLTSLQGQPVPAWSDIDVWGIILKTKEISLDLGNCRLLFRQLDISDFEEKIRYGMCNTMRNPLNPPESVLRMQIETAHNMALQQEARKVLVLLRLLCVCSVDFGQEVHETSNPFAHVGPAHIGGTNSPGQVRHGRHSLILTDDSKEKLVRFWKAVEPRLPGELHEIGSRDATYLAIAYQRYCDGLFTIVPFEQKIAAAIMGLEAIYFGEGDMQELTYKLSLRVSKVLSKLDMNAREIQSQLKIGYKIRSLYVHGSSPSSSDWKKVQKTSLSPEEFATRLLDYLRISILHLICSRQEKSQFLELVEESLVSREKDDLLCESVNGEKEILKLEFP